MKTSLTTHLNSSRKKSIYVLTRSFAIWNKMLLIGEFESWLFLNDSRFNSIHVSAVIPDFYKSNRPYFREISVNELLFDLKKKVEPPFDPRSSTFMAFCSWKCLKQVKAKLCNWYYVSWQYLAWEASFPFVSSPVCVASVLCGVRAMCLR